VTETERFEEAVFPFIAEIVRLGTGYEATAITRAEDERSAVVVCENGNVYRVKTRVVISRIPATEEGEVQ
jgi:hypothetical protein